MKFLLQLLVFSTSIGVIAYSNRDFVVTKWEEWSGIDALRADKVKAEARLKTLEGEHAETDRDKLEEALKKLEKEFSEYKEKYKTSMRAKAPGLQIGELTVSGKQYLNATVLNVTDEAISLSHPGGVVRVDKSGVPPDLAARLALLQSTPMHEAVAILLAEVAEHKAGVRKDSDASVAAGAGPWRSRFGSGISKAEDEALRAVAIISIETQEGSVSGSGFIAHQGIKNYFYTNAHVAAAGTKMRILFAGGQSLKLPGSVEISDEPDADDLVRFEVVPPAGVVPLKMSVSTEDVGVDNRIIALGNSGGAGVIPVLRGRVRAFGPFAVEVDASVIKGNSGGPVLLEGTSAVVGVVSRYETPNARDMGIAQTQFASLRRICLRPDQVSLWKTIPVARLVQENNLIELGVKDSYLLSSLLRASLTADGVEGVDTDGLRRAGSATVGPAIAGFVNQCAVELRQSAQKNKSRPGPAPRVHIALENFHRSIQSLYGADIAGVDAKMLSRFHSAVFHDVARNRSELIAELEDHFVKQLAGIQ